VVQVAKGILDFSAAHAIVGLPGQGITLPAPEFNGGGIDSQTKSVRIIM